MRYALNITAPKCIKETLTNLKREIANSTIIVGDFEVPTFNVEEYLGRPSIRKQQTSMALLTKGTDRIIQHHSNNNRIHILLKSHGDIFRVNHMLGNKTESINKCRENLSRIWIFSNDSGMKLEINNRKLEKTQRCKNQITHS